MEERQADTREKRLQSWLEGLLHQRVCLGLQLEEMPGAWVLSVSGDVRRLVIERSNTDLTSNPANPLMTWWDSRNYGTAFPIDSRLPAPGLATDAEVLKLDDDEGVLGYDILSLAWWMLSRVEEVGRTDLDGHDRFPATASHAFRHGYLERPIVDEWFSILRQLVGRVWPGLPLVEQRPSMRVSHDVDSPSRYAFGGLARLVRTLGGDVLRRCDFADALRGPRLWVGSRKRLHPDDPSNTFDWIMDRSDEHGLTSAFYFICGRTNASKDAAYDPEDSRIRALMRNIHARGHEIGLHPSYGTFRDRALLAGEATRLRHILADEGIEQSELGGRMHFLRWETPTTLYGWEEGGMTYDSTMSYADLPGFRCGTCHEYSAFDPVTSGQLKLKIRPLVAMECTVMAPRYLGLGDGEAALEKFVQLKRACHAVGGCFTTLWHNTYFEKKGPRDLYLALLAA